MKTGRRRYLLAGLLLALLVAAGLALARPWHRHSPLALATLFHPDRRIENFRTMDEILPYRKVAAADEPFRFRREERPLEVRYTHRGETRTLEQFLDDVVATGLLIVQNDAIVTERYFRGATAESRMTSWSMAKSFVSTLVGIALGDGRIRSLDDPISAYAPVLEGTGYDGVPIRHVLQMSSGVEFDETYSSRFSDINLFFVKVFVLGRSADSVLRDHGTERPSGEVFHYVSLDTQALGAMLRHIYDKPLAELLEERLWKPLGMEGEARWNVDREGPDGVELAFCCLNARLRDYAKLGRLYLRGGIWNDRRLLPHGWTQEATHTSAAHLQPGASPYDYGPRGYQYQWWFPADPDGEYLAAGIWGQYIYVSEPDDLIIVRTSVDPDFRQHMDESVVVFRAIRDALRAERANGVDRMLEAVAEIHGDAGPWAVAGYRMGRFALQELGVSRHSHALEVVHHGPSTPMYACIADGAAAATGASPGKLNLSLVEADSSALRTVFMDRATQRTLTLRPTTAFASRFGSIPRERLEAAGREVASLDDAQIFEKVPDASE